MWFEKYALAKELADDLPALGLVAFDEAVPLAAGFVRKLEGNYALLDGLIANPERPGKRRCQAIDQIVLALKSESKKQGLSRLIAYSHDSAVLRRSLKHGFQKQPDTLLALDL